MCIPFPPHNKCRKLTTPFLTFVPQVEGKNGMAALAGKLRVGGPSVLFHGALAASAATFVGHYPWFAVYNFMNEALPK